MSRKTYRLPEQLGGGTIVAEPGGYAAGKHTYIGAIIEGVGSVDISIARPLEEVKPPSIDDPAEYPLTIDGNGSGRWFKLYDMGNNATTARVGYMDRDWGIDLTPTDLRAIARAAWQRANAIEAVQ